MTVEINTFNSSSSVQEAEARGYSYNDYAKSTIVQTSAPVELGSLRKADGQEGFDKAKQAAREGFEAAAGANGKVVAG